MIRSALLSVLCFVFASIKLKADDAVGEMKSDDRPPSQFKVGDEWLALPEVFSNLDFYADNTPAKEDDIEGQLILRSSRFWGRLYIDGWPQTIQFFRAHFGIEPPMGKKIFVFAEPRDACQDLSNAGNLTSQHVLLVARGTCTFGTKAKNANKTNASAIIIINNEPGIDHLPGPDAHDIQYSVSSIPQLEGQLLEATYDDGPLSVDGFGRLLEGYIVPVNCENSGAKCLPATYEERRQIANLNEGGTISVVSADGTPINLKPNDLPIEYLLAHFGTKVPHSSVLFPVVIAKPAEACGPLENNVRGKAVLVRRGNCPFVGVEPRWKGLNTFIPVVMVSFSEEQSANLTITSSTWEPLEQLFKGEGWPRSDAYVKKKYEELLQSHSEWPDRVATLEEAYAKKTSGAKPSNVKSEL
eukprot:gene32020-41525_t